jgi:hypothetical protein
MRCQNVQGNRCGLFKMLLRRLFRDIKLIHKLFRLREPFSMSGLQSVN